MRQGDARIDEAQRETGRILATVGEGLFLIDPSGRISPQFSAALPALLGAEFRGGGNLYDLITPMGEARLKDDLQSFIDILFAGRVKPALISQLNPMHEVELEVPGRGQRYLTFSFTPVHEGEVIPEILVTAHDVTERIALERELQMVKDRARGEFDLLMRLMDQDPGTLARFVEQARSIAADLNQRLMAVKSSDSAYRTMLDSMFRAVHRLKGEAYTLQLDSLGAAAHRFEDDLGRLQNAGTLQGEQLIPVSLHLKEVIEELDRIDALLSRMQRLAASGRDADYLASSAPVNSLQELGRSLNLLLERIATDTGKVATLKFSAPSQLQIDDTVLGILREITPQFVRNAIAHGIEPPEERLFTNKPAAGLVSIDLRHNESGDLVLTVRDDGQGLSASLLRRSLMNSRRLSPEQLSAMNDRQIIMQIFQPGVTTAAKVTEHAGRGVGLDAVRETLAKAAAKLRVQTEPGVFTQFEIRFMTASNASMTSSWMTA